MTEPVAKKSLGQHWLKDDVSLEAMCHAANVQPGDVVLEIGPGTGELTKHLLNHGAKVIALEFDESLHKNLIKKFVSHATNFTLLKGDIRTYDLNKLPSGYKIVANIPYYLTSHLIRILSESLNPPTVAALLVQKEVAERVCAKPGDMSLLSVTSQVFWQCSLGSLVPAHLFEPAPKVDSQILILDRLSALKVAPTHQKKFFSIVKAGFSNRRKTLHNSLSAGLHVTKPQTLALLEQSEIKPQARAQELSIEDWLKLSQNRN